MFFITCHFMTVYPCIVQVQFYVSIYVSYFISLRQSFYLIDYNNNLNYYII